MLREPDCRVQAITTVQESAHCRLAKWRGTSRRTSRKVGAPKTFPPSAASLFEFLHWKASHEETLISTEALLHTRQTRGLQPV